MTLMAAGAVPPLHGSPGCCTAPEAGVAGVAGKKVLEPAVTCPSMAQVWESRALKEKVTVVVVKSAQVTSRRPVPWVKAQEFEFDVLLGVNVQLKFPDAGPVADVVVPVPEKV